MHIEPFDQLHSTTQIGIVIVLDHPDLESTLFRLRLEGQNTWTNAPSPKPGGLSTPPIIFKGLNPGTPYKIEGEYFLDNKWIPLPPIITHTTVFEDPWAVFRYYVEGVQPVCMRAEGPGPRPREVN